MVRHIFLALSNAIEGHEGEFNRSYNDETIPAMLKIPGVVAARRYELSHTQQASGSPPWKYLAIYELETDDIQGVVNEMKSLMTCGELKIPTGVAPDSKSFSFAPITDRCTTTSVASGAS
jgi:hypothetical protein